MTSREPLSEPLPVVDERARQKAEEFIEKEEGAASHFKGWTDAVLTAIAVGMSLFHLYAAQAVIPAQIRSGSATGSSGSTWPSRSSASRPSRTCSSTSTTSSSAPSRPTTGTCSSGWR